jgi:predicted MFS family arabinose efflux permease
MNVPLVLACLWLIARFVPEIPGARAHRIDLPGALLCALGLAGPVYALIGQPRLGWSDPSVWIPLVAGIGAFVAFISYERRAADPMLPLAVFRSRNFAIGNLVTFVVYAGLGAATFFIALFLQQVAGYTAFQAGLSLLPITLLLVALARRFGALSARIGPRLPMTVGPLVGGLGLLAFARLDERADYVTQVLPASLLFGLGLAITVAPLTATVLQAADRRHAGVASGVNNAIARIAGLLAIAAVGAVVSAQFASQVGERLPADRLDPAARAYVRDARERPLTVPAGAASPRVRAQVTQAGVSAFRTGMIVSALLMIAGGVLAAVGIENPRENDVDAAALPAAASA